RQIKCGEIMTGTEWIRMTEQEWLSAIDPQPMLMFLGSTGLNRKHRLFACACARRVWHLCDHELPRQVLELGERFADALVSPEELRPLVERAHRLIKELDETGQSVALHAAAALSGPGYISQETSQGHVDGYAIAVTTAHEAQSALAIAAK